VSGLGEVYELMLCCYLEPYGFFKMEELFRAMRKGVKDKMKINKEENQSFSIDTYEPAM
jgi:hypothetical protein